MENFKRELERNRVKRDAGENVRKKWSVLFINSTGKVYNLTYIRSIVFILLFIVSIFGVSSALLFSVLMYEKNINAKLLKKIETADSELIELKNENEQLRIKLAFLKPPDKAKKTSEKKEEIPVTENNDSENKNSDKKIDDFSKIPLEVKNIQIENFTDHVKVNFELVNISKSDLTISGYVFVMLKNDSVSQQHWMTSPYSQISGGKPLNPLNGQFFSIMRFKPVTIKFPGISNTGVLNQAEVFVYAEDGELVLKKGFRLDEN